MTYEEAKQIVLEHGRRLVAKWEKTQLLDKLSIDTNMSILLESQPKQLLRSEMTEEERQWDEAIRIVNEHNKSYGKSELSTSQTK